MHQARTRRALALSLSAAALSATMSGGCGDEGRAEPRVAIEPTCSGALAISSFDIYGTSLPAKTLSLSFDDGPGARTAELSTYLKARGIAASFFVNGKMLNAGTAVLQQLVAEGHMVANHTQTHTSLTGRSTGSPRLSDAQVVSELTQTDALIAPLLGTRALFRAPYGDFDAQTAAAINASPMAKYVGPINWDIGDHMGPERAADWDCWTPGSDGVVLTSQQCGDRYVKEIDSVGRGIVLLHDPYFVEADPSNGTVDMVKYIVPILIAKGYAFVRIDRVPAIAALLPVAPAAPIDAGVDATIPGSSGDAGHAAFDGDTGAGSAADASTSPRPCAPAHR